MKMSVYLHRRKRGLASECSRILGIFDEKILTTRCVGANAEEAFAAALFLLTMKQISRERSVALNNETK